MISRMLALLRGDRVVAQAIRFGMTGIAATALHGLVYLCATGLLKSGPFAANALGYAVAMPFAFVSHFLWSFRSQARSGDMAAMALRFLAINAVGFGLNTAIVWLVCARLELEAAAAVPFMATLTPVVTFLLSRNWGFRQPTR